MTNQSMRMQKIIIVLFLNLAPTGLAEGQSNSPCDSMYSYFDSVRIHSIGLVQYEKPAKLLNSTDDLYLVADNLHATGTIIVELIINRQGNCECQRIVKNRNLELDEKALELVRNLRFAPAEQRGKTMLAVMVLPIEYGPGRKK